MSFGRRYPQSGQAMTEFVIVSAAVLVPLIVMVSLLGKWIHSGFSADLAARYLNWEHTVWFAPGAAGPGLNPAHLAIRNRDEHSTLAMDRVFYGRGNGDFIESSKAEPSAEKLDPMMELRSGKSLVTLKEQGLPDQSKCPAGAQCDLPKPYQVLDKFNDALGEVFGNPAVTFLSANDDFGRLNHNFRGYSKFKMAIPLNEPGLRYYECGLTGKRANKDSGACEGNDGNSGLQILNAGAIVSDSWNAQDASQFRDRSRDFALGSTLEFGFLKEIGNFLNESIPGFSLPTVTSKVPGPFPIRTELDISVSPIRLAPDLGVLLAGSEKGGLGYVGTNPVPPTPPECKNGLCLYDKGQ